MALRMSNKVFPQAFVGSLFSLITENSAKGTNMANMFFKFVKHTLL